MAEVLKRRVLRERTLGSEEGDVERRFQRQASRHDLAEQTRNFLIG